ncbi:uncharacterized protein LOC128454767 isoform X2 [Pleuronectes platessa]|uniref:uncharacterized protein LOC128454767 isoform X2 n=1 Tax=Pleuronectes platessa TaxID=8262 RepID=UPI00232A3D07|nr:uncharacterized protein LOC128454767 isoform X2 [Pleuronectes platessa]
MMTHLSLGVIIVAVLAATVADADVKVVCEKDSVKITWRISAELVPNAARLFLGSCMPTQLSVLPTGEGEAHFNYKFADCKFKKLMKGKRLIYQNELTYRPQSKMHPAALIHPIECVSEGQGELVVHMALLNAQLTGLAKTNVIPLGSFMPIWAAVEQKSHQPLLLLMEECVAASTPELHPGSPVYPIIANKGCLLESVRGHSLFLPRYHSSALILYLQSFKLGLGEEVYIHCKLVVWDPADLDETKKTCHYVKDSESWELLDDPLQSSLCSCCDSTCKSRSKRGVEWESHSQSHNSVLGPLVIVDQNPSSEDLGVKD